MNHPEAQGQRPLLSKSRFLAGAQCHLRLWYQYYHPELASEITPAQKAIFETGHRVGELATRRFPAGILIEEDYKHHEEAVRSTRAAISDPSVKAIFEGAFEWDAVRVRADILERMGDGRWNLIEVKSATSVKPVYLQDLAIQYHVLKGSGLNIAQAGIMHLNSEYVYNGRQLEPAYLFSFSDLTERVVPIQGEIRLMLGELQKMLTEADPPEIMPSRLCKSPHECEFWENCTRERPAFWVFDLTGIRQDRLESLMGVGIQDIRDIPDAFPLSRLQERIRTCVINQKECVLPGLEAELKEVAYPIHFLDFETVSPAIPRYAGTRPYQAIPFQWSDHILYEDESIQHREYLCDDIKDPRGPFSRVLLETLGKGGTIFVFSNYERGIVKDLAEYLPGQREQLLATLDRFRDLQGLIKRHFYKPEFYGSFSLKSVLPALVPDMNYKSLTVQEGSQASFEYLRLLDDNTSPEEKGRIKGNLLAYCGYDTLAMLKIREELLKRF